MLWQWWSIDNDQQQTQTVYLHNPANKYEYFYNQIVITYLHVINIIINYCFELWGDCTATKWILLVSKLENHKICIEMLIIKLRNSSSLIFWNVMNLKYLFIHWLVKSLRGGLHCCKLSLTIIVSAEQSAIILTPTIHNFQTLPHSHGWQSGMRVNFYTSSYTTLN